MLVSMELEEMFDVAPESMNKRLYCFFEHTDQQHPPGC
jgi:hypothetical protein